METNHRMHFDALIPEMENFQAALLGCFTTLEMDHAVHWQGHWVFSGR